MAGLENEATQYESPNERSGNAGGSDLYESPSSLNPLCDIGNEHLAPRTQITFRNNRVYDHWKLNILIYTIEVL
jgi:hypothetical protein